MGRASIQPPGGARADIAASCSPVAAPGQRPPAVSAPKVTPRRAPFRVSTPPMLLGFAPGSVASTIEDAQIVQAAENLDIEIL